LEDVESSTHVYEEGHDKIPVSTWLDPLSLLLAAETWSARKELTKRHSAPAAAVCPCWAEFETSRPARKEGVRSVWPVAAEKAAVLRRRRIVKSGFGKRRFDEGRNED
jgi:hypothetical protein